MTDIVLAGATAVAYNISAVDTSARGWFAVTPGDAAATYRSSTVNWPGAGDVIDNGQFVKLDANRQLKVFNGYGPPTNFVIEVLGYFTPSLDALDGTYFHALDPARAYDSRVPLPNPGPVPGASTRNVSVADGRNPQTGAVTSQTSSPPEPRRSSTTSPRPTPPTAAGTRSPRERGRPEHLQHQLAQREQRRGERPDRRHRRPARHQCPLWVPSQTDLVIDLFGYFR